MGASYRSLSPGGRARQVLKTVGNLAPWCGHVNDRVPGVAPRTPPWYDAASRTCPYRISARPSVRSAEPASAGSANVDSDRLPRGIPQPLHPVGVVQTSSTRSAARGGSEKSTSRPLRPS